MPDTDDRDYAAHLDRISPRPHEKGCDCEECDPPDEDPANTPEWKAIALLAALVSPDPSDYPRVSLNGVEYVLIGDTTIGGPIATAEEYRAGAPPFAYLCPDGCIMRFRKQIATLADLVFIEDPARDHGKMLMDRTLAILDEQDQQREIDDRDRECGRDEDRE